MGRCRRISMIAALALASAPGSWSSGTGSLTGTVTDVRTGAPLAGVSVSVYTCSGRFVASATTNASGVYATPSNLDSGWYLLRTRNALGYINQLRQNQDCIGDCDVILGNPVPVGATAVTVNFALRPGGRISGTVRSLTGVVPGVTLEIYDAFGTRMTTGLTDTKGVYRSQDGLLTGTYHVVTRNQRQLLEEAYDNVPCPFGRCDATLATAVPVTEGATTTSIDFALSPGGRITGRVISSSGLPATGQVDVYDAEGFVTTAPITKGNFLTETGLVTGTYFAKTLVAGNDIDEVWDRMPCGFGGPTSGRPIAVTVGAATTGIDFTLSAGGVITGRVTDGATGLALDRASVIVYDSAGAWVNSGRTNTTGDYTVGKLCTASYRGVARGPMGRAYVPELYRETTCSGCDTYTGTPIPVTAGATTAAIHFTPRLGSRITGVVTDAATHAARKGLAVNVFNSMGRSVGNARVDCHGNGVYLAPENEGLPAGNYFLNCDAAPARPYSYGYRTQFYDDRDCFDCDPTDGDAVAVGATTAGGVNFDPVRWRRNGDYDLDGKSNLALYHPDTGDWIVRAADGTITTHVLGGPEWRPAPNDFDGDGKTDPVVYDDVSGRWRVKGSVRGTEWSLAHGGPGATPLRADLDGDGWADYLLYDGAGHWSQRIRGTVTEIVFGAPGNIPVPADYDGDDRTDLALYDPATGAWAMRWSRNLTVKSATFGGPLQAPVTGDFDGDGRADLATFESTSATWRIRQSSDGRVITGALGSAGGVAVPFDYDGDGRTDIVTYAPSSGIWQIVPSSTGAVVTVSFGGGPLVPLN
jgi:hypothetical protein